MKNDVKALNDILFEQLERLMDDESLKDEKAFKQEISRAREVSNIARSVVQNHSNMLTAMKMAQNREGDPGGLKLLGIDYKKND